MGRKMGLETYATLLVFVVIGFLILRNPVALGLDAATSNEIFTLAPAGMLLIVSIYGVLQSHAHMRFGAMVCVGISLSWMLFLAEAEGLVTAEMLMGLTIRDIQTWTILISVAFGAMISR